MKDIILTFGGVMMIMLQVFAAHPDTELLIAGLAMSGIGASFHLGAIMSGFIGRSSSESSSSHGSSPSSISQGRSE